MTYPTPAPPPEQPQQNPFVNPAFYTEPPKKKSNTSVIITAIVVGAILIMCLGCLGFVGLSDTETTGTTSTETPAPASVPDNRTDMYLTVVRDTGEVPAGMTDADLVAMGKQVCADIDAANGDVMAVVVDMVLDDPDAASFNGSVVGAAVPTYCPEYSDELGEVIKDITG